MVSYKHTNRKLIRCVSCGNQGKEMVIDFWGCNLNCLFCFAWQYSHKGVLSSNRNKKKDATSLEVINALREASSPNLEEVCWVRFTGGEPFWRKDNISDLIQILTELNNFLSKELKVLIQTNGLMLNNYVNLLEELGDFPMLRILIEVSFKGTNPREFSLLTGADPKLFYKVIKNYRIIDEFQKGFKNISICSRLGIFHDVRDNNALTFVYPNWEKLLEIRDKHFLMFHQVNWCAEFKSLWEKVVKRGNMATEYLKLRSSLRALPHMVRYLVPLIRLNQAGLLVDRSEFGFSKKAIDYACDYLGILPKSPFRTIPSPKRDSDKKFMRAAVNETINKFPKDATQMFHLVGEFP